MSGHRANTRPASPRRPRGSRARPGTRRGGYGRGLPDAAAIAGLHLASYRAAYQDLLPAKFLARLSVEDRERRWRASLADPRRRTLIAHGDGSPAPLTGFAEVGPEPR
jgi:hypothetical protein